MDFLQQLFDTSDFPPRWQCGRWSHALGWLHIVSDTSIAAAYFAIPLLIGYFAWKRRDLPFLPIFWLFALFIFCCGFGHLIEATIFWHPWYRLAGMIKLSTASVSWLTVITLVPLLPKALALPGLAVSNRELAKQINEHRDMEQKLLLNNRELQAFLNNVLEREERILQLKAEVNELLRELGRQSRYATASQP